MRVLTPVLLLLTLFWLANLHVRLNQTHGTVTVSRLQTRPYDGSVLNNDCASVDSFLAAHRHNLRSVALCPFSIRGAGNTDIVYVRASD